LQRTTAWPAVNAHPDLQALVVLQRPADLKGALRRFLRTFIEHQRHAVAGRDFQYTIGRFSFLELLGQANNPVEFINSGVLFVNGEFRVADNVEEEHVRDLKLDLLFNFGGHSMTPLAIVREQSFHCYCIDREQRAVRENQTKAQDGYFGFVFGASEATIFSKRGSPRSESQEG